MTASRLRVRSFVSVALLVTATTVAAVPWAQQPVVPLPTYRTGVDVVQIDVSVLDKHRRPVRGLEASDFTVLEDGQPRRLVAFSSMDVPEAAATRAPWQRDVRPDIATNDLAARRLVLIVMDDATGRLEPAIVESTKRIASRVVDALGPADLAAVLFTAGRRTQNFTDDRERLRAAVGAFTMAPPADAASACPARRCVTETLGRVAALMRAVPERRKTLFYISTSGAGRAESAAFQAVSREAQWANVTMYALDPSGLADMARIGASPDPTAALRALQQRHDALRELAESSGGRAVVNSNDPGAEVAGMLQESASYYLLGFQRDATVDDGRLHRLTVSVRGRDVEVRARRGYYGTLDTAVTTRAGFGETPRDLRDALLQPMPSAAVALTLSAAAVASRDLRSGIVALTVGVRQPMTSDMATEEIRTAVAAFDEDGKAQGWRQEVLTLALPVDGDGQARYEVLSRLELPPGHYEVRVALARASGATPGSVQTSIDIPDYASEPLSMSGLILESTASPVTAPLNVLEDALPMIPTTLRAFTSVDRAHVLVRVYQGGAGPTADIQLSGRILNEVGSVVFEQPTVLTPAMLAATRAGEAVFELPLASLPPGPYLLRVEAASRQARRSRDLRFVVLQSR